MWKHLYESPWHNPAAFIAVNAVVLILALRTRSILRAFLLVFTAEILLDATLTNDHSIVPAAWRTPVAITFVILGDARVLVLFERVRRARTTALWRSENPLRPTLLALGLAFFVPVLQAIALRAQPSMFARSNAIFLVYECIAFISLTLYFFTRIRPAMTDAEPAFARWARAIYGFVLVQYGLWASADVLVLSGHDLGYALRLIPNFLYYAVFLPFVWRAAPAELR